MSDSDPGRLRRLFDEAFELPPAARAEFLDRRCGGDVALRDRLLVMLGAAEDTNFLADPTASLATPRPPGPGAGPIGEEPGTTIGPYRLRQQLGEGGFGVVFLAEQNEPVSRQVALKVLKPGMDSRQVVARFEQERQALALMDHPNIARVLDAGTTPSGRPFFVMDLVRGEPITAWCDTHQQTIDDRLRLFAQVCHAVQHAHGKGIIHRDLKPSNVLVTTQDGVPQVKVIDFGIAKAMSQKLTDKTLFTEHQQVIGTLQYMSPEQADGSPDIDTRSDVYSLGVLLYELLTGSTPFDRRTIREAMLGEVQRLIREVEPPKPSTRMSQQDGSLASVAAQRRTEPRRLGAQLRGELDWIVMKALEKERGRRYETANGLAQDIERHLRGEAIVAAPPSAAYRLRKFVRRNRGVVAATAAVGLSLVAGVVAFAWQAGVAQRERNDAIAARNAEAEQHRLADERATQLAEVAGYQEHMLAQIDPTATGARLFRDLRDRHEAALRAAALPTTEGDAARAAFAHELSRINATDTAVASIEATLLLPAVAEVGKRFAAQPLVDATLRATLAALYDKLGRYDETLPLLRSALETREKQLGHDHPDTLRARHDVAHALERLGKLTDAEPLYRDVHETRRRIQGPEHQDTLAAMAALGENLREQSRTDEAGKLLVDALELSRRVLGAEHRDTLVRLNLVGFLRIAQGRPAEAEPLWREALETGQRVFGADDPDVIVWTNNLGGLYGELGRIPDAERLYRQALAVAQRVHGNAHPATWTMVENVAALLDKTGRSREAEPMHREVLDQRRRSLGDEHPDTLAAMQGLGQALRQLGRVDEAEPLLREVFTTLRRTRGARSLAALSAGGVYARFLMQMGRLAEAETLHRELLAAGQDVWPPEHPDRLIELNNLGNTLLQLRRPAEAEPLLREALAVRRRVSGDEHPETLVLQSTFARARENQGELAEAEALYRDATAKFRKVLGDTNPNTQSSINNVGLVLLAQRRFAEAEPCFRETLALSLASVGEVHLRTASSRRGLGRALAGQRKFAEAERELLTAQQTLMQIRDAGRERQRSGCEYLESLYTEWHAAEPGAGHDAAAAEWRAKAAALAPAPDAAGVGR